MEQNQQREIEARNSLLYISMNEEENRKNEQNWDTVLDFEKKRSGKSLISNLSNEKCVTQRTRRFSQQRQKMAPYSFKQQENFVVPVNAPETHNKQFHSQLKREFFTSIKIGMQRSKNLKAIKNINTIQVLNKDDNYKEGQSDQCKKQLSISEIYKLIKQQDFKLLVPAQRDYKSTLTEKQASSRPVQRLKKCRNTQLRPSTQYNYSRKGQVVVTQLSSPEHLLLTTRRQSQKQFYI